MLCRVLSSEQVNFACPGLLGTYPAFVKHYEKPIVKSRHVGCSEEALEDGRMRADEVNLIYNSRKPKLRCPSQLGKLSREFVLRRTANVLENYLPPKRQ